MRCGLDDRYWQFLGAPADGQGFRHGRAGRLEDGCQIDCWLKLDGKRLEAVSFAVFGSLEALRMAGWLAEWLQGAEAKQVPSVSGLWLAEQTAVSAEARGAALVIEDALHAAFAGDEKTGGGC